jgi:uncharacterized protein YcfJ
MKTKPTENSTRERDTNPDPITGEPGAHPVGTGIGAAAAGATGAAIGSVAGPFGTAIGAIVGAVAGGYAGKGIAEVIDPSAEDTYWRENHRNQPFAEDEPYDDYAPAYRQGYMGFREGQTFADREADLRMEYEGGPQKNDAETTRAGDDATTVSAMPVTGETPNPLRWEKARDAARVAYERVGRDASKPSAGRVRIVDETNQ